jgi:hypothetical protein
MLKLRHPASLLAICLLIMLATLRSFSTPSPVGPDEPDVVFSAIRAEAILRDLLQEEQPHPVGSGMNRVVRDRIVAHFEAAGYEPEIRSRFQCNPEYGSCADIENIVAVKPGSDGQNAVLVTAHYDSVWTGAGAADDGAGVSAILEIARMAADYPPYLNDVIFLITDAEETGLIGARAFAEHDPLFARVKFVVNLEARGVSGPSTLFETGEGNRSIIRIYSKNVPRPSANSLVHEIYKAMPNDTDYSVYRDRGVMGLNFAFAGGVALYHSALDDPDHLDLGSLQHHGDNAWALVNALGDRDLSRIRSREDAGYIDLFSATLIHYPVSIVVGMTLVLGVWVMLAIAAAFRKEFRYRQLRWGLLAVPVLLLAIPAAGYLLSWPLGQWLDMNPLEHPMPWPGRVALFIGAGLVLFTTIKIFSGRVSACAWMIIAWFLVFAFGIFLTRRLPTAAHVALIPLAAFALGSVVDLFRKKSPAPLLVASIAGFAAAAFISWHHFFLLGSVMNFDRSAVLIAPLAFMALVAMPMLLAFASKRNLDWWPAKWLGIALLAVVVVHLFMPAYTAERPRDMTLMYREVADAETAYLVLESVTGRPDRDYASKHDFNETEIDNGRLGTVSRPARPVAPIGLPGATIEVSPAEPVDGKWRHELNIFAPQGSPLLVLNLPVDIDPAEVRVNGQLAIQAGVVSKKKRVVGSLRLLHPGTEPYRVELLTDAPDPFQIDVVSRHELPGVLVAPFMGNWPDDAQPKQYGKRAEKVQRVELPGAAR